MCCCTSRRRDAFACTHSRHGDGGLRGAASTAASTAACGATDPAGVASDMKGVPAADFLPLHAVEVVPERAAVHAATRRRESVHAAASTTSTCPRSS